MKNKKIIWGIVTIITIVVFILWVKQWNVWFGNPKEQPYLASSDPGRIMLTFGNDGERSRNISWQCDSVPQKGWVELVKDSTSDTIRMDAQFKLFKTTGGKSVYYWTKLKNLVFHSGYKYRVRTGTKASGWYRFSMPDNTTNRFSFVYFGDVQDSLGGKLKDVFTNVRHQLPKTDFYVFVGDLVERPMDCYWQEAFNSLDSITQTKPIIVSPGNHEYIKGMPSHLEERFTYTLSYLIDSRYKDNNVFSFDYKDATIITLDSNRDFWYLFSQKKWLKEALEKSKKKWKIVVLHHPIYSIKGKYNNLIVRLILNPLIKEYGVDLVLEGHEHNYARMTTKKENGDLTTPVYLVSHCSPKDYRLHFNDLYDRYGNNQKFYQNITVTKDTLRVQAFIGNNQLYDDLCIIKNKNQVRVVDNAKKIPQKLNVSESYKREKPKDAKKYEREMREWLQKVHK
ncbi:metallophosphoesterase [uncultured Bacteroides sp.]|uniref:metallophosphoesterase family protein n=1 Tax=uncultured Bacteroides sp. TaxID=162156 RepID=UPI002AA7FFE5|nr:metallophosphoesterase [uncultured Bacteroides sp.]